MRGFTRYRPAQTPKGLIIEFQWPKAKPRIEPVEGQYYDDLSAFFKQLRTQRQGEAIESFYVDDLPAFFKRLKER